MLPAKNSRLRISLKSRAPRSRTPSLQTRSSGIKNIATEKPTERDLHTQGIFPVGRLASSPEQRQQAAEGAGPLEQSLGGEVVDNLVPEVAQAAEEALLAGRGHRGAKPHLEVE